ncbi:16S rRNA (guanine(966)-N(2))-methyltransferase RsmD [Halothiobacillus sp. 15-55-196]|uniref:16S rRNA (guanine(966)-N(2))-methyltransferase RsmD n=1 Tax=Halothiobacillus sp. 15-55-196 TaxID=1970382 RepID=UPI0025BD6B28|nr:16S rRNA (guanine(966)-N(2))-methyltransferase RsmD [Halothiobacillus sp. 15-55-196]
MTSSPRALSGQVVRGKQVVRVTGGEMRSRRLHFPAMPGLRPTPDRVRETLFNWLGQNLDGWRVLDLFAGSGILGIESISRGAQWVGLIEQSARVAAEIRRSLKSMSVADERARVWSQDALGWLRQAPTQFVPGARIDLVFLDPPFACPDLLAEAVERLQQADWLADGAYMYIEQSAQEASIQPVGWVRLREGRAGESAFALWRRETVIPPSV